MVPMEWVVQAVHIVPKFKAPLAASKARGGGKAKKAPALANISTSEFYVNKFFWGHE